MYMYSYDTGFNLIKMLANIAYLLYDMIHYYKINVKETHGLRSIF